MDSKYKFDLYCWACDFSSQRGEGILARHYIKKLSKFKKKKIFVKSSEGIFYINNGIIKKLKNKKYNKTNLNLNFHENYIYPLLGVMFLWYNYLKGRGICYLNFLPLWNSLLFIFLPPKTHLGPVTGFIFKKKVNNINSFFRKYFSYLLFKINIKILFLRQNKIYFSTDLLKSLVKNKNKKQSFFNYLLNLIEIKKIKKKDIDLLVYNRNYSVKNNALRNQFLKIIENWKLKIFVIGDYLPLKNIKNLGFVSRKKVNILLEKTNFIINSGENPYNIFTIDAYNNHVNIIYENIFSIKLNILIKKN